MPTERVEFLGVGFDPLTMDQVLERVAAVTSQTPYGYVVTPNVDHVVKIDRAEDANAIREAFASADLSVCDSRILTKIARLFGVNLPVVPGSDLTVHLLKRVAKPGDRICIVGGDQSLSEDLVRLFPQFVFDHCVAPMGLRQDAQARARVAAAVAASRARYTLLAVGSPQQEMIAAKVRSLPGAVGMAFCIGASLDFITGRQKRAPLLLQKLSLEWAYRLGTQPLRLWRRYLVEGPAVFLIALRGLRRRA